MHTPLNDRYGREGSGLRPRASGSASRASHWLVLALLLSCAVLALPSPASAQFPTQAAPPPPETTTPKPAARPVVKAPPPKPMGRAIRAGEVETAPIKCWWKTDTTEVRIGQRFGLTLTCGVIETPSMKVTANTNSLDAGAVQLTPFEVVSGTRRDDVLSPPWRYFQYDYQVRLLSEGFFGQDMTLPSLKVTYNIQAAAGDGAEGRDLQYQLPALPMRVASLVPRSAADIRDVAGNGFDTIATRRFRASVAVVTGAILLASSLIFLLFAVAKALGRVRRRRPTAPRLGPVGLLGACVSALNGVKSAATREGWSPALARRALAPLRIAAAVALGRTVHAQVSDTPEREGQLAVRHGIRRMMVSAATTSRNIERALNDRGAAGSSRPALEKLKASLQVFNASAYGRGELDSTALDRALADSLAAVSQLRLRSLSPFKNGMRAQVGVSGLSPSVSGDRA